MPTQAELVERYKQCVFENWTCPCTTCDDAEHLAERHLVASGFDRDDLDRFTDEALAEEHERHRRAVAESGHEFYITNVGHSICRRCGLIPFDDDAEEPCPGTRERCSDCGSRASAPVTWAASTPKITDRHAVKGRNGEKEGRQTMTCHNAHESTLDTGLNDECPRCAEHAEHPLWSLDRAHLAQLRERIALELPPRTKNEGLAMANLRAEERDEKQEALPHPLGM